MTASALVRSPVEAEVARLRGLQRGGDHAAALAGARAALADYPRNRDLRLIEASALRHLGETEAALAALDHLAAIAPDFSLMHQERGLAHVARRDAPAAIAALGRAVAINPALPQAWKMLAGVHRLTGDAAAAEAAAAQGEALAALPPPVVRATALFADGEAAAAEAIIRAFLVNQGDHPEAMRLLARIGVSQGVHDDAELLYAGVLTLVPDHTAARLEYVQVLAARQKFAEARAALVPLIAREPANPLYRNEAAAIAVGLGRHDEAIVLYRGLLAEADAGRVAADLNLCLGHALKTIGAQAEAIACYREAVRHRPAFGEAWWSLANLKIFRFDAAAIGAIEAALADPTTDEADRTQLHFALAKAREDAGDAAAAWAHYAAGNALQRAASHYRPEVIETNTREQKRVCTAEFFAARAGWGAANPAPIFIVGLPRAGSTLIEQILASHPLVEGTQELPDIQRIVHELNGREPDLDHPAYPQNLTALSAAEVRALGERYLAETQAYCLAGRPYFIDKMPNNFRHIGLIHLILPQARIIDARRGAMACCFSNLKQLFARGQEFTYSQADIARYYRTYLDLMRHWDRVLPGRVHRVINEDVIEDLEREVRRLLAYCGLPFDPACLAFHQTVRAVRTPSSEQVRRPVNRDGVDQWRAFAPWLGELETALGPARDDWRE